MPKKIKKPVQILSENLFPVVGVGASAGGLDAFKALVKAIPADSGMAYIFVQHLTPHYDSILADILQKITNIPVIEIRDNLKIVPDHIYVIPSNKLLTANDGVLLLDPRIQGGKSDTINIFFTSLAEIHQEHTIGVVLSGTGSDGTVGLKTIKDLGGVTIVQDKESSAYYGMPQSAIDADVVDFVLSPQQIPAHLIEFVQKSRIFPPIFNAPEELKEDDVFRQILSILRAKRGVDFTYYKQTTIRRRIIRRKALNKIDSLKDYQIYLLENKAEQDALFKDILIPVTAFFRDPQTFTVICKTVLPTLFKSKSETDLVRIWIAGCSTGEEAYSIAICLYEYLGDKALIFKIQIFATDISEAVIAKARSGIYQKKDMAGVSDERIQKFFNKIDGSYQVNKVIRGMCVFACQDFLKDPPFSKLDLISCRNVLIYMDPYLQKKALSIFHYALNHTGFLLLGKSETIGQASPQFQPFSNKDNIYTRKLSAGKFMPVTTPNNEEALKRKNDILKTIGQNDDFSKAADEALHIKYSAVGAVVNEHWDILQFRGSTGAYLEQPPGKASLNILKMAREGLPFELRNALHKAKISAAAIKKEGITIDKGNRNVDIEVIPLKNTIEQYFLVLFSETPCQNTSKVRRAKKKTSGDEDAGLSAALSRITQLEVELARAREDMRAITEDQEAANEELQSANEELLSGSEELQSLNEELETSKEEIQSTNEELTILNQELIERNEQLVYARRYAEAIVSTIHEPLLVLTKDFYIKSANKSFHDQFKETEQQIEGKLLFEICSGKWDVPNLREKLQSILPDHSYFEDFEVKFMWLSGERILVLNGHQIINENINEKLILLAIHDVTDQKLFTQQLEFQVLERTKELKEANINLQHSNENLQQFASIASHDLQEPLRKIKTFTALLNRRFAKDIPAEGSEIINKIKTSSDRMSLLIKEVLEYSKVVHSHKSFVPTDLEVILKNVMDDLDLLVTETGAVINHEEPLPVVEAIPLQMNQLFYNLVINSLKFHKQNTHPVITISVKLLSDAEAKEIPNLKEGLSYIEIKFSDNGIGFEQEFAVQIFQLFERLHSFEEFEGTGVGLALCKKIVDNHHGHIFAHSNENEGAAFHVIMPVKQ